jgi:hypothetical protein
MIPFDLFAQLRAGRLIPSRRPIKKARPTGRAF